MRLSPGMNLTVARMHHDELTLRNVDEDAVVVVRDINRPDRGNTYELTPGMSLAYCAEPNNDVPRELEISTVPAVKTIQKPSQPPVIISNVGKSVVLVQQDATERQDYGVRYCLELQPGAVAMYPRQTTFKIAVPEPLNVPKAEIPLAQFKNVGNTMLEFESGSRTLKVLPGGEAFVNYKTQTNVRAVMTDEHGRQVDYPALLKDARADADALRKVTCKQWDELQAARARVESLEKALSAAADALARAYQAPSPELVNECVEKAKDAITRDIQQRSVRWQ